MKKIPLTKGLFAIVDDEDFEWLNQWKWYATKSKRTFYAARCARVNGKRVTVRMHRVLLGLSCNSIVVDHKDHNGLNNQRHNIRACILAENAKNKAKYRIGSTSKYKGVSYSKQQDLWLAVIASNGTRRHIGYFRSEDEAARHYNVWAKKLHGEFAHMNNVIPLFPTEDVNVLQRNNKSGFRGVHWHKLVNKWNAQIKYQKSTISIGWYLDPEEAARAYDAKARELYGDTARLNFPHQ